MMRALVAPDGDHEAAGEVDVDLERLGGPRRIARGAGRVEDEQQVVAVRVELRPLAELARVLDRHRVQVERLAELRRSPRRDGFERSIQKNSSRSRSAAICSTSTCERTCAAGHGTGAEVTIIPQVTPLDAYSQVVVGVAERLGPSVANLVSAAAARARGS